MNRIWYNFYTGPTITAGATINDAAGTKLRFIVAAKTATLGATTQQDLAVISSTVVSGNTLVTGDYDLRGSTVLGRITTGSVVADLATYNDIDMNSDGVSFIQSNCAGGTAVCKFVTTTGMDADNSEPTWASAGKVEYQIDDTDNSLGGLVKPVLSVDWTAVAAGGAKVPDLLIIN